MTPGKRIEQRRKQLQLSQDQLADLVNTQQNQISRIELDEQPGRKHLALIAEKLQVPLTWITTGLPLQPWEWEGHRQPLDLPAIRHAVASTITMMQDILRDLDRAISPTNAGQSVDDVQRQLESDARPLGAPADSETSAPGRRPSPRHPRNGGAA